jgi:tetratricopeptide (TPR) repeat protein
VIRLKVGPERTASPLIRAPAAADFALPLLRSRELIPADPSQPAESQRSPTLDLLYEKYLHHEQTAQFIRAVSQRYLPSTLCRLAAYGSHVSRRAAVMALTFLGDYSHNAVLGRALQDRDRGVRMLADNGIRGLWRRDGNIRQQADLGVIVRLVNAEAYHDAVDLATDLLDEAAWFAEVWNQRGIAHFALRQFEDAANDCHQTLELNPYHFGAAVGIGHCYLEMDDPLAALESFRRALHLNPGLEDVRAQVNVLQKQLDGR